MFSLTPPSGGDFTSPIIGGLSIVVDGFLRGFETPLKEFCVIECCDLIWIGC
jgi:hypothetical protein